MEEREGITRSCLKGDLGLMYGNNVVDNCMEFIACTLRKLLYHALGPNTFKKYVCRAGIGNCKTKIVRHADIERCTAKACA